MTHALLAALLFNGAFAAGYGPAALAVYAHALRRGEDVPPPALLLMSGAGLLVSAVFGAGIGPLLEPGPWLFLTPVLAGFWFGMTAVGWSFPAPSDGR